MNDMPGEMPMPFTVRMRRFWPAKLLRMSKRRRKICLARRVFHSAMTIEGGLIGRCYDDPIVKQLLLKAIERHLPKFHFDVSHEEQKP